MHVGNGYLWLIPLSQNNITDLLTNTHSLAFEAGMFKSARWCVLSSQALCGSFNDQFNNVKPQLGVRRNYGYWVLRLETQNKTKQRNNEKPTCYYIPGRYSKTEHVVVSQIILQINVMSPLWSMAVYGAMRINNRETTSSLGGKA